MNRAIVYAFATPLLIVALGSCGTPRAPQADAASGAAPAADYKNIEYSIGGRRVALVAGVSVLESAPGSATVIVTRYFGNDVAHDLNDDGQLDVVFLLTQDTGGSGVFYYAVAALATANGYVGSQGLLLGDRIVPQTTEVRAGGIVVVNYADRRPGEPFTTPPSIAKTMWLKLDPQTLQFGEVVQDFEGEADPVRMTLRMKTWVWIGGTETDGAPIAPLRVDAFTLTFGDDGVFSATTDCNQVTGTYTTSEKQLAFGADMASTRMYCDASQEASFTELLAATSSFAFTSRGELLLTQQPRGSMTFR
jgi:heat shock protein HslJ